ncbi:putative toxin-antitoxin system toxin component, PIN family [Thermodesulfobacteriota bacterium]
MRIVLDTNVLVSALLKPRSKPARILRLVIQGDIQVIVSEYILAEYLEVLKRPKFDLNPDKVQTILEFLRSKGIKATAIPESFQLPNSSDEPFLEAALSVGADALITGNKRHFPKKASKGQKIVNPDEFLRLLSK